MKKIFDWDVPDRNTISLYFSLIIVIILFLLMEITYQILFEQTIMVISHLFYFPIVLCSFFLPKRGVIISTFIAMIYLIIINYMIPGVEEIVPSTMQFYVYVSISVTVSLISERIRRDRKKFSSIFEYSEGGIGLFRIETGELIDKNKKYARLMEKWPLLGSLEKIGEVCPDEYEEYLFEDPYNDSPCPECEISFSTDEGKECSAIITASKIPDGFAVLTVNDITDIRSYQKEIAGLNSDLSAANEKANMYLDILIHDINNANAAALGYAELIKDGIPKEDEIYYEKMMTGIRHSSNIISNVTRIREIHNSGTTPSPVQLDEIIESAISGFPELDIKYENSGLKVSGSQFLADVFSIILDNSANYGGKDVHVSINTREEEGYIYVTIEDDGPGIPDSKKETLFKRFQPGGDGRRGRGLGLPVSWLIVRMLGGEITVSDKIEGRSESGAVFTVKLKKSPRTED